MRYQSNLHKEHQGVKTPLGGRDLRLADVDLGTDQKGHSLRSGNPLGVA